MERRTNQKSREVSKMKVFSDKELKEIKNFLNKSENPLFFFDDDADGLCSHALLRKYTGNKGESIPIKARKSSLDESFIKFVERYSPDYVFITDKPVVDQDFLDKINVPVIWLDHHPILKRNGVKYYNSLQRNPNSYIPVSQMSYEITKKDLWIATTGTISDYAMPPFYKNFLKKYPDLSIKTDNIGKIIYETELGKLTRIANFILKGKISSIRRLVNRFLNIKTPYEILNKTTEKGKEIDRYYNYVKKKYDYEYSKVKPTNKNTLIHIYKPKSNISFTGDLVNEISYHNQGKLIIVARESEGKMKMSLRYKKGGLPKAIKFALKEINGFGGGHDVACGAAVNSEDFDKFVNLLKKPLNI